MRQVVYAVSLLAGVSPAAFAQQAPPSRAAAFPPPAQAAAASAPQGFQEDYFTTSDGVKIHYLTAGTSGSWVVLIHGYTDNAERMWFRTGIAPAIANAVFHATGKRIRQMPLKLDAAK